MVLLGPSDLCAAGASIVNGCCFRCGLSSWASSYRADGFGIVPWPFGGWLEESLVEKRVYCLVVAVSAGFAGECAVMIQGSCM